MKKFRIVVCLLAIVLAAAGNSHAVAQSGGPCELTWDTLDSSGSATGGPYALDATVGQPEAGEISGGDYTLGGGFWGGGAIVNAADKYKVYLPVVIR